MAADNVTDFTDDEPTFPIKECIFDPESLRNLLLAAKAAGVNLSGLQAELQPDGRYIVNHDPAAPKGPARDQ